MVKSDIPPQNPFTYMVNFLLVLLAVMAGLEFVAVGELAVSTAT